MLSRELILSALGLLSKRLEARDVVGEINLLRGTAMVVGFSARQSTKDVDAIFAPVSIIREAAAAVAAELELPEGWLNDAKALSPRRPIFAPSVKLTFHSCEYKSQRRSTCCR